MVLLYWLAGGWLTLSSPLLQAQEVVAGIPKAFPPHYSVDQFAQPQGFAIDVMEQIAARADITIRYQIYDTWYELNDALQKGAVDLVPNMGITPERSSYADFTIPYETFSISLFVRTSSDHIQGIEDLQGRVLGVVKSNVAVQLMKQQQQVELKQFVSLHQALFELISGNIDALAYPEPVMWKVLQQMGLEERVQVVPPALIEIKRGVAVAKGHEALQQRLQHVVGQFIATSEYKRIYSEWFGRAPGYWSQTRIVWLLLFVGMMVTLVVVLMLSMRNRSLNRFNRELKRAHGEQELAQSIIRDNERRLRDTERIAHIGSWELDLLSNHLYWSDEVFRIFDIDQSRFAASYESFLNGIHPDDRELVNTAYTESLETRTPYEIQHRLLMSDGSIKWVLERGFSEYDDSGKPICSKGMVQDITREVEASEQLKHAMQAKDEFLASMSHELRTPLTAIIGNSGILAERMVNREKLGLVRTIEQAANAQLALVNDILDLSKIESGQFTIDEVEYDLEALLQNIQEMMAVRASDAGIDLRFICSDPHTQLLMGDSQRIGQILINLVGNAIKFTEQGAVTVTTAVEGRQLLIKVEDSGIGMTPAVVDLLFQRFQQADSGISRKFGGSGLGLYISQSLAELMGGEIRVSSELGEGSCFVLQLPYQPTGTPVVRSGEGVDEHLQVLSARFSGNVLVAEDTVMLQLLEKSILEQLGLQVTLAQNGEEAVALAQQQPFALIFMDMQMPVMDGVEATRALRALGIETPIVALTANAMKRHRAEFESAGCSGYLAKPFDKLQMIKILQQYL